MFLVLLLVTADVLLITVLAKNTHDNRQANLSSHKLKLLTEIKKGISTAFNCELLGHGATTLVPIYLFWRESYLTRVRHKLSKLFCLFQMLLHVFSVELCLFLLFYTWHYVPSICLTTTVSSFLIKQWFHFLVLTAIYLAIIRILHLE